MKTIAVLVFFGTACARAEWKDLKEGVDQKTAEQIVGAPLFGNRSRGGTFTNWVYDNGGYILFENGRVRFWQQPVEKAGGVQVALNAPAGGSQRGKSPVPASSVSQTDPHGMALRW